MLVLLNLTGHRFI